jgi:predicted dehydrogenase
MSIRTAVIGVGSMGKNHARVYSDLTGSKLVAIADPQQDSIDYVSSRYHIPGYADYIEMLEVEKPQAVTIAVPTSMHRDVALTAMEKGADILIEKPIAATIEEANEIITKANELGRILMIGHIVRFNSALQELKRRLDAGELGRVFQIFCRRAGPFPARIRDVGVVVDLAPHDIDVMRYLIGKNPKRVYAETEQRIHTEHEDMMFAIMRFPEGITGALEINWLTPTKIREVLVLGERGLFRVDDLTQDLYFYENAHANGELWAVLRVLKGVSEGAMVRYPIQRYEPLKAELEAFLKAVAGEAENPVTGEDGLAALKLALALVESGKTHQVIEV